MTSVTFPCGCEINETHVLAMCIKHDHEMRLKRLAVEEEQQKMWRDFHEGIERCLRGAPRRSAPQK